MKKITVSVVTMLTALALTVPAYAAGEKTTGQQSQQMSQQSQQMSQRQSAEEILGMSVVSRDGENLGEIQDIKIDTKNGRISYLTVQKGGVMGIGGEEGIAVPLEAFQFTQDNARLTVDKNKLDTAPKAAGMSDQEFQRNLHSHYGVSPAWQQGGQSGMQSGSQSTQQMSPQSGQQQKNQ